MGVAQSVRAPDCGSGGRRFESGRPPLGRAVAARARRRPHGPREFERIPVLADLLTGQRIALTIEVYRATPERPVHRDSIPNRAASVFKRLRPPAIFDNRGHEKRAGPSPASTVSRRFSSRSGRTPGGRRGSITQIPNNESTRIRCSAELFKLFNHGEFDPGSGRTLAACLTHASRTRTGCLHLEPSGERVSNT